MLWGHKRPRFGIEVAREIPGVFGYFLVATSVKAELSLDLSETAAIVVAAVRGRQDMVKDYGTLTDQSFCPLILRLDAVMVALDKMEKETGKKVYIRQCHCRSHCHAGAAEQAMEAWKRQIFLQEYAKDHKELDTALKYWGYWGEARSLFPFPNQNRRVYIGS